MGNKKLIIESIASDLKRVTLGVERNSMTMASRFLQEAQKREGEAKSISLPNYILNILKKIRGFNLEKNRQNVAEDCLMYSTLLQNFSQQSKI